MEKSIEKYQFYNLPQFFLESDYQEVCGLVVDNLRNNRNIKSIYLSSGEWVPGISDVDIIIVCRKDADRKAVIPTNFRNLSKKAGYLFCHNSWVLDENSFKDIYYLVPSTSLKLLWGEDIPVRSPKNDLSSTDYQFFNAVSIFDFLVNKLLILPCYLNFPRLDTRRLLGEVYSLVYTLEMLRLIEVRGVKTDFPARIKKLRKGWFNNHQTKNLQELISLYGESVDLVLETVTGLSNFAQSRGLPTGDIVFKNRKYHISFDKEWTGKKFLDNFADGYISFKRPFSNRIIESFKLVLPLPLSYFFTAYAAHDGILSGEIRKGLKGNQKKLPFSNRGIDSHIGKMNDYIQNSIDCGFTKLPLSYGYLARKTFFNYLSSKSISFLRTLKEMGCYIFL